MTFEAKLCGSYSLSLIAEKFTIPAFQMTPELELPMRTIPFIFLLLAISCTAARGAKRTCTGAGGTAPDTLRF